MTMSKRTWTGEELQQHLDGWVEQMQRGDALDVSLSVKSTLDPWKDDERTLTCGDDHIALTMTQALVVQDWFRQRVMIQETPKPSPRDTQFAGFARLLWDDLINVDDRGWIDVCSDGMDDEEIAHYRHIITQRTYDLLKEGMKYLHDYMPDISDIPDMTAWPKDCEQ